MSNNFRDAEVLLEVQNLKQYFGVDFKEADIVLKTPFVWHTDGEMCSYNTKMHVECIPGAIKLIK